MGPKLQQSNFKNSNINPCIQESELVEKCLNLNLYDSSKCDIYFQNVKKCKQFWNAISRERGRSGISPNLPTEEERAKILELRAQGIKVFSAKESE